MLTLILLVVLGVGAGLLAVSLGDADGLSRLVRSRRASLRGSSKGNTTAPDPAGDHAETVLVAVPDAGADTPVDEPVAEPAPVPPTRPTPGRRPSRAVPAAFTAVEGTYREVARPPWWRRVVSLVALAGIVVVIGVVIAALAGAAIGATAELVDGAIG